MSESYHADASDKWPDRSPSAGSWAKAEHPLVILVDDDERLREALDELMQSVGLDTISFGSTARLARSRASGSAGMPYRRRADAGRERSRSPA